MAERRPTRVGAAFSRLSTAAKMLIILGVALLPLGLVALLASIDAARDGRAEREALARVEAVQSASAFDRLIDRDALALRIVLASSLDPNRRQSCQLVDRVRAMQPDLVLSRLSLISGAGREDCSVDTETPATLTAPAGSRPEVTLDVGRRALNLTVGTDQARAVAAVDFAALRRVVAARGADHEIDIHLQEGNRRLVILDAYEQTFLQRTITSRAHLQGSNVFAVVSVGAIPISAVEIASILLPLLMWIAASLMGWIIVDRLLLRPIVKMQQAVLAYRPGDSAIAIPDPATPATEIHDLGQAFARVTNTVAAHEAELEAAIARQARLVREVHHRVKNNLQVVASLLNLHARGAKSGEAAGAYATIQRRVDALSVVHRNHFAELEDNRGVALRPLLSELTGNLRATAPEEAAGMAITLELDSVYVNQDVAVSVAFFVTEVVEHAMLCTPHEPVGVSLRQSGTSTSAKLTLSSASLRGDADCPNVDARQFERITTGLSRQLRGVLQRDPELGVFSLDIMTQASPTTD